MWKAWPVLRVLVAAAPAAAALVLLLLRVRPTRAAAVALGVGLGALAVFATPRLRLVAAVTDVLMAGAEVVAIILGGVLLYQLMVATGAQKQLGSWAAGVSADRARGALLVVLGVTPFTESATGFGVGVIVAAPLLRAMGLSPRRSAVLALLGLLAVPWGALAPGTLVAAELSGVPVHALGVESAVLSLPVFLLVGAAALVIAVGRRGALAAWLDLLVAAGALWLGILVANLAVGTAPAGVIGSLVAVAAVLGLVRIRERRSVRVDPATRWALRPYLLLVTLLLASRVLLALVAGPGWQAAVASPAPWLLITCAVTPVLLRACPLFGAVGRSPPWQDTLATATRRWFPVALTTVLFLLVGAVMTVSGMSATLARTGADLGRGYLLLAPWIGGLGGFLTGSNVGANAMFASAQAEAARALGYPLLRLVAAHNVAASLLTMASAPRVALALSLSGDDEAGGVLRMLMPIDAVALVILGVILVLTP